MTVFLLLIVLFVMVFFISVAVIAVYLVLMAADVLLYHLTVHHSKTRVNIRQRTDWGIAAQKSP